MERGGEQEQGSGIGAGGDAAAAAADAGAGRGRGRGRGRGSVEEQPLGDGVGRGRGRGQGAPSSQPCSAIGKKKMVNADFSTNDRSNIRDQLETFIIHMRRVDLFKDCHDFGSLAMRMVQHERDIMFPLVYRLIKLALLLPVATASVERAFSAMNIIKTDLRNKMSDEWLNDLILCYVEKELFKGLDGGEIKKTFQDSKNRNMDLPRPPRRPRTN